MMTKRQRKASSTPTFDTATYYFDTRDAAWAFMGACDKAGLMTGFPDLLAHTVKVAIRTWMEREQADKLAGGMPINYQFGSRGLTGEGLACG